MMTLHTMTTGTAGALLFGGEGTLVSVLLWIALAGATVSSATIVAASMLRWRMERNAAEPSEWHSLRDMISPSHGIFPALGVGGLLVAVAASFPAYLLTA